MIYIATHNIIYQKLVAMASSSFNNFVADNDEELLSELDRSSDRKVIKSSAVSAVPWAKVGHQSSWVIRHGHMTSLHKVIAREKHIDVCTFCRQHSVPSWNLWRNAIIRGNKEPRRNLTCSSDAYTTAHNMFTRVVAVVTWMVQLLNTFNHISVEHARQPS